MKPSTGLQLLRVDHLRCLSGVELVAHPRRNIFIGENGVGKTSLLEAIYFLGRGKSFRPGPAGGLIQKGQDGLTLFGEIQDPEHLNRVGVSLNADGLEIRCDGEKGRSVAELAARLPVQVIDPQVHELIQGGPKERRQFLDWGVFHVKHSFLEQWRRYRRVLQQRNASLRQRADSSAIRAWDDELLDAGAAITKARRLYLESIEQRISSICSEILEKESKCAYLPGWSANHEFADALQESWSRDRTFGTTHVGPHRAELAVTIDGEAARHRLSRGQQKLLSISMVLAQSLAVAEQLDRTVTLLVDEPAAELDSEHLQRLFRMLDRDELQLFITALDADAVPKIQHERVFHVEHHGVRALL